MNGNESRERKIEKDEKREFSNKRKTANKWGGKR